MSWLWMLFGGAAGMAATWAGQRSWAARRETQMEAVATRARERSADGAPPLTAPAPLLDLDALDDPLDAEARSRVAAQRSRA